MNYTYDALQRLTHSETVTNHMLGNPLITYDPNGNIIDGNLQQTYDVENHVTTENIDIGPMSHPTWYYDTSGKRVVEIESLANENKPWTLYLYDIFGHLSATLTGDSYNINVPTRNAYFGNRLIQFSGAWVVTDRLGSVRANSNGETFSYLPYGEERTATANARIKFGTYTRDSTTYNQDYADQRYYNPWFGRFSTPDPTGLRAADRTDPITWNRYAYATDDPVNRFDPLGLDDSDCNALLSKINKIVFGDDSTLKPTKGLMQRFDEQIHGDHGPGTKEWDNHNIQITNRQTQLKRKMKDFIDDNAHHHRIGKYLITGPTRSCQQRPIIKGLRR